MEIEQEDAAQQNQLLMIEPLEEAQPAESQPLMEVEVWPEFPEYLPSTAEVLQQQLELQEQQQFVWPEYLPSAAEVHIQQ